MQTSDLGGMSFDLDARTAHGRGRPGSVIRRNPKTGQRHLDDLIWGLLPHDTKDPNTAPRPINARAETAREPSHVRVNLPGSALSSTDRSPPAWSKSRASALDGKFR